MIEILLWVIVPILIFMLVMNIYNARQIINLDDQNEDEQRERIREQVRKTTIHTDVFLENINNHWYGWTYSTAGQEHFVAQGDTLEQAKQNCADRLMEKNNKVIFVIKFIQR